MLPVLQAAISFETSYLAAKQHVRYVVRHIAHVVVVVVLLISVYFFFNVCSFGLFACFIFFYAGSAFSAFFHSSNLCQ